MDKFQEIVKKNEEKKQEIANKPDAPMGMPGPKVLPKRLEASPYGFKQEAEIMND